MKNCIVTFPDNLNDQGELIDDELWGYVHSIHAVPIQTETPEGKTVTVPSSFLAIAWNPDCTLEGTIDGKKVALRNFERPALDFLAANQVVLAELEDVFEGDDGQELGFAENEPSEGLRPS